MSENGDEEFAMRFKNYTENDILRFTKTEIPAGDDDTTTDEFYSDVKEIGENNGVAIIEYMSDENNIMYSVQIPNCSIWITEEMLLRINIGIQRAVEKINKRKESQK